MNIKKFTKKTMKKLTKVKKDLNLEESSQINNLILSLQALLITKKEDKLTVSEIADLIEKSPFITYNDEFRFPEEVSIEGNKISVWYHDAGEWEVNDDDSNILTIDSVVRIKDFFKSISVQVGIFESESYERSVVKFTFTIN